MGNALDLKAFVSEVNSFGFNIPNWTILGKNLRWLACCVVKGINGKKLQRSNNYLSYA